LNGRGWLLGVRTRGGGGAVGGLQNDDGRFSAKWSRKRNFVLLVDKYFGTRGVWCKKFKRVCCSKRTFVDPKRINMKREGVFANSDAPLVGAGPPDLGDQTAAKCGLLQKHYNWPPQWSIPRGSTQGIYDLKLI
jgi:hypothetical protein